MKKPTKFVPNTPAGLRQLAARGSAAKTAVRDIVGLQKELNPGRKNPLVPKTRGVRKPTKTGKVSDATKSKLKALLDEHMKDTEQSDRKAALASLVENAQDYGDKRMTPAMMKLAESKMASAGMGTRKPAPPAPAQKQYRQVGSPQEHAKLIDMHRNQNMSEKDTTFSLTVMGYHPSDASRIAAQVAGVEPTPASVEKHVKSKGKAASSKKATELVEKLSQDPNVKDPEALAAWIGRRMGGLKGG